MKTTQDSATLSSKRLVARIAVSGLFGHYDYDLACPITKQIPNPQFTILYGDNGSGKTTILKLLYAILSPNRGKGYRTFIARTLFRNFSVHFSDGLSVSATRSNDEIQGAYTLSIHKDTTPLISVHFTTDETPHLSVRISSRKYSSDISSFLEQLAALTLPMTFLPEHRKVLSNPFASYNETAESYFLRMRTVEQHDVGQSAIGTMLDDTLAVALDRAAKWIDRQVMGASTLSDQSAAQIYAEVIQTIAQSTLSETTRRWTWLS
jgi:energy-coupling factor transporter ATP-binding protein EcfA2